jgi:hypothetical protein
MSDIGTLERDREDVEAGEHVLGGRAARARDAAEIVAARLTRSKMPFSSS